MIKAILLDFDGVLVDSIKVGHQAHMKFCQKHEINPFKDLNDLKSKFLNTHTELYLELGLDFNVIEKGDETFKNFVLENNEGVTILKNMDKVIPKLAEKYKLGIVSNNFKEIIEKVLKKNNLLHHFSFIIDGDEPGSKSERINHCLNQFKIQNHEAIFVGDMIHDIIEGRKANVKTIILSTEASWNHEHDLIKHNPDILINDPEQLLEVIENDR
ncbi:MAG: HAD family hydrolase [Nanoarchaeota archaeon]|nr:HAD family hydrolase [Nanoarchaeota archaeon]